MSSVRSECLEGKLVFLKERWDIWGISVARVPCLAVGLGFEPRFHGPEPCCLPLADPTMYNRYYTKGYFLNLIRFINLNVSIFFLSLTASDLLSGWNPNHVKAPWTSSNKDTFTLEKLKLYVYVFLCIEKEPSASNSPLIACFKYVLLFQIHFGNLIGLSLLAPEGISNLLLKYLW